MHLARLAVDPVERSPVALPQPEGIRLTLDRERLLRDRFESVDQRRSHSRAHLSQAPLATRVKRASCRLFADSKRHVKGLEPTTSAELPGANRTLAA